MIPTDVISGTLHVTVAQPPVLLDGNRLAEGLAAVLTSSMRNMPLLPAGTVHPDAMLNASVALAQNFPLVVRNFAWGGFLSRICSYEIHTRSAGAAIADVARPEFAGYDAPEYRWMCAAWDVPEVQDAAFAAVASDAPTLVVGQELDPRWDPLAPAQLRAGLSHLSVLPFATLPGGAVPGDFPACYNDLRRQFVRDPNAPLATAACRAPDPPHRLRRSDAVSASSARAQRRVDGAPRVASRGHRRTHTVQDARDRRPRARRRACHELVPVDRPRTRERAADGRRR